MLTRVGVVSVAGQVLMKEALGRGRWEFIYLFEDEVGTLITHSGEASARNCPLQPVSSTPPPAATFLWWGILGFPLPWSTNDTPQTKGHQFSTAGYKGTSSLA